MPGEMIDHINRVKLDNRRENLRLADKSLNSINRDLQSNNTTGYKGVYLHYPKEWRDKGWAKSWAAVVQRDSKSKCLGYYKTPREAHEARESYLSAL